MIVVSVTVHVRPEHVDDFIAATIKNHEGAIEESGCLRFDVCQASGDPARFLLYEVYESEEAVDAHKETEHYQTWRDSVADWMARPREGVKHSVIRPGRDGW